MTRSVIIAAGVAAAASAQPTIDGSLAGDEGFYGDIRWVQNQPTSFGDNHPDNVPPSGNPQDVLTGIEFAIPLSAIGGSPFSLAGYVVSGDHTFSSNQHMGGLPNLGNLGGVAGLDLSTISGDQFVNVMPGTVPNPPIIDGILDPGVYGAPFFLQNNFTGFGDAMHGNIDEGGGSEIDGLYAVQAEGILYVFITGNLEANNNALELFFDSVGGGENVISGIPGGVDNNALEAIAGLTFDAGFEADFYMTISGENIAGKDDPADYEIEVYLAELGTNNSYFLGAGNYGSDGSLSGADGDAPPAMLTIDNTNIQGVTDSPSVEIPSPDFAVGSEVDGLYAYVDQSTGRLYLLVTGNIESNYNKLNFFFDAEAGGQNTLRGDNVDISFNGLNRMGENGNGDVTPGLTFDDGFNANLWININTGDLPIMQYIDSAYLRTDGPAENINGAHLDYGCYKGGLKTDNNPIMFNGPLIDAQDGFTPQLYSNFAPVTSYEALVEAINIDPFDPQPIDFVVADRIIGTIDNSNIGGVTGNSVDDAANVTTGMEFSIALAELGVTDDTRSIKITGFIAGGGFDFISNQVVGGLPSGDNLGEPTTTNFAAIEGNQYVEISLDGACFADCNDDGLLNILDFVCYQQFFQTGNLDADCNGDAMLNILDFVCFQQEFLAGCP